MPRVAQSSLTGRRERIAHRNVVRSSRNWLDTFKSALIFHEDFDAFSIGPMNITCAFCGARHFGLEKTGNDNLFSVSNRVPEQSFSLWFTSL